MFPNEGLGRSRDSRPAWIAAAKPESPVSELPCGRMIPSTMNSRSLRRSRGISPARKNDDFPLPEGPRTTNNDLSPDMVASSRKRMPSKASTPRAITASRPKNTPASISSNGSHPRYGARSGSVLGGQTNWRGPVPLPSTPSMIRVSAAVLKRTGGPSGTSMSLDSPSANKSQRCQAEVMSLLPRSSNRATRIRLPKPSAVRYSTLHSVEFAQFCDSRQMKYSQRDLPVNSWVFHCSPSFKPVWVSTSMKISSPNSGRCSVSHALSAIASRVSLLEWLKKIRDTYVYPPFVEAPESRSTRHLAPRTKD